MHRVLVVLLGLSAMVSATPFQDCGSVGEGVTLDVEDCDIIPCVLERGRAYTINFKYTSSADTDTLEIAASATIAGLEIPWPGLDTDGCKELEGTATPCPISAGTFVDWQFSAALLSEYPAIVTVVTFKLTDAAGNTQTCAKVPASIV